MGPWSYGAAGSLVGVIVWVYYASMILLFGATLTCVRSRKGDQA
jgi:membrane protein